ncbi:hypothetical protein DFJ43DRAFT_1062976 [Lentinula guzmanii]|uniref:Uncharacterized protein n=1 Tax=Lentinula guzmanii TaxID=2804957 RepID=A0AA38JE16_9AGAR|nr:hypothetical protein DFJ43DRAFT_1062976 [Lentinula guzmanii]
MDINDSAGIRALLEQLETSQAWQDTVASSHPNDPPHTVDPSSAPSVAPPLSVAALLSQLQTGSQSEIADIQSDPVATPSHALQSSLSISSVPREVDSQRSLTFQQALPLIASQSANPRFCETLKSMKKEQDVLEMKLSDERKAILSKYEARVQVAKTKASMIGSGISRHEANMLLDAVAKELKQFDVERVLPAWDGLALQQQEALAQVGVPTITDATKRKEQQKIMQVLEGLMV